MAKPWRRARLAPRRFSPDEAAVFQDEVDLNLNPDIGCCWMEKGKQAEVVTPGTNVKRYLSGVDELADGGAGGDPRHAAQRRPAKTALKPSG